MLSYSVLLHKHVSKKLDDFVDHILLQFVPDLSQDHLQEATKEHV